MSRSAHVLLRACVPCVWACGRYSSRLWAAAGMPAGGGAGGANQGKYEAEIAALRRTVAKLERERDDARHREETASAAAAALQSGTAQSGATALAALGAARGATDEVRRLQTKVRGCVRACVRLPARC